MGENQEENFNYENLKAKVKADFQKRYCDGTSSDAGKLALQTTADIATIERDMAINATPHILNQLINNPWIELLDRRQSVTVGDKKTFKYVSSFASFNPGEGRNIPVGNLRDAGRYGKFFENIFFGGGADNLSIPDYLGMANDAPPNSTGEGTEYLRKVWVEVKSKVLKEGESLRGKSVSHSKHNTILDTINNLNKQSQKEGDAAILELQNRIKYEILKGYAEKTPNLLIAGVQKRPYQDIDPQKGGWSFLTKDGWQTLNSPKYAFYFSVLEYFARLIIDQLILLIDEEIVITKKILRSFDRNVIEVKTDKKGLITSFAVSIKMASLPSKLSKGNISEKVREKRRILYKDQIVLFDATKDIEIAREYFKKLLNIYNKQNDKRTTAEIYNLDKETEFKI